MTDCDKKKRISNHNLKIEPGPADLKRSHSMGDVLKIEITSCVHRPFR